MEVGVHIIPPADTPFIQPCLPAQHWAKRRRPRHRAKLLTSARRWSACCRSAPSPRSHPSREYNNEQHDEHPHARRHRAAGAAATRRSRDRVDPTALPLLALRFAIAVPFFYSGLTKWDGFLQLSGGAEFLFTEEFRLHIFGQLIPYPYPILMATMAASARSACRSCSCWARHTLRGARHPRHDGDHPAHRAGRLGEFPPALGGHGAGARHLWRRRHRTGPADLFRLAGPNGYLRAGPLRSADAAQRLMSASLP